MANFKGRKPSARRIVRAKFLKDPRWWDVVYHRRPHRVRTKRLINAIRHGADPDGIAWPIPNRPQIWYW